MPDQGDCVFAVPFRGPGQAADQIAVAVNDIGAGQPSDAQIAAQPQFGIVIEVQVRQPQSVADEGFGYFIDLVQALASFGPAVR